MKDDVQHGYLLIVQPEEHKNRFTLELAQRCSRNFSKPVVFRKMAPLDPRTASREFLEVEPHQKLLWREQEASAPVTFRDQSGKTDYNYVTGREGTASEYLDEIFVHNKNVYAHLGHISSGFQGLHKHPWGGLLFDRVRKEILASGWYQVPEWELTGHLFLGNNTETYPEPSGGAPGSDWHMFPTLNIFVLVAGKKRWMSYPPRVGDQLRNDDEVIFPSGGRENPLENREFDTVYLEPGDVLFNVPYEWHKVLNAKGWSMGVAFRVIDKAYVEQFWPARPTRPT